VEFLDNAKIYDLKEFLNQERGSSANWQHEKTPPNNFTTDKHQNTSPIDYIKYSFQKMYNSV